MITVADDDRLLNRIGSAMPVAGDTLGELLLSLRQRAEARPMPMLVDTETALAVIAQSRRAWGIAMAAVSRARAAAAAGLIATVLLTLGLCIAPYVTWWWAIPVLGCSALGGTYLIVWSMKPDPEWSPTELTEDATP